MQIHEILQTAVKCVNTHLRPFEVSMHEDLSAWTVTLLGQVYKCVVKPNLSKLDFQTEDIIGSACHHLPMIYVTIHADDKLMDAARKSDKNIMDCKGNFQITAPELERGVCFTISGAENRAEGKVREGNPSPIIRDAGLKVLFYLLQDRSNILRPFRDIREATGVSLGTIKNVMDGLVNQNIARVEGRERLLIDGYRLLTLWSAHYIQTLRPKSLLGRMRFRTDESRRKWYEMKLPDGMYWGGEAAASIMDGFMNPGEFLIYSDVPAAHLVKTGAILPDPEGEIAVYRKFWKSEPDAVTVPPVLTYADLVATGNSRCLETAENVKNHALHYLL